jgi:hypothetical protein
MDFDIQATLTEFENTSLWKACVELRDLQVILGDDLPIIGRIEKDDSNRHCLRRAAVRAVFALIEGVVHRMKHLAYETHVYEDAQLPRADVALLLEESYELNEKGAVIIKQNFLQIEKNIKFAFAAVARAYGITYQLNVGGIGWDSFKKTLKVRNRLTHPKNAQELIVSDEEIEDMKRTYAWFLNSFKGLLDEVAASLNSRAQALEDFARGHDNREI